MCTVILQRKEFCKEVTIPDIAVSYLKRMDGLLNHAAQ
jgi:hypothetical protein